MKNFGNSDCIYQPLDSGQVEQIHSAALNLLAKTGIAFEPDINSVIEKFKIPKGFKIDKGRMLFNSDLLIDLLLLVPEKVTLYSRDQQRDIHLFEDNIYFSPAGTMTNSLDLKTGKRRSSKLEDFYRCAQLVEGLDNMDMIARTCTPNDIPVELYDVNILYAALKGTKKHINLPIFSLKAMDDIFDMVFMLAGGAVSFSEKPFVSIHSSISISPLKLSSTPVLIMAKAIEKNAPVSLTSAPMAGSTSPVTLAGTLTVLHAELMAMAAITQLIKPGTPVILSPTPSAADLSTMGFNTGTIEASLLMAASHQLAKHIKVPNFASAGWSSARAPDAQAGWETASSLMASAMAGGNLIRHAAGFMENGMTLSFEHFVMSDHVIGMIKRMLRGIVVDEGTIGLDAIKKVGPGGNFLVSPHTMKYMRKELYTGSGLVKNPPYDKWVDQGSPDVLKRANKMVLEVLKNAQNQIPADFDVNIRKKYKILL